VPPRLKVMNRELSFRLQGAVREGVARCVSSDTPLTILAEFVEELRQDGWTKGDIHLVEMAVLNVVAQVVFPDEAHEPSDSA
jgi:hypothetical protein